MITEWKEIKVNGDVVKALITEPEKGDREYLRELYFRWKELNDDIKKDSTRGINLPEFISETAFCLFFPSVRVVKLKNGKCSYDCIDKEMGRRQQIKATSTNNDLTSFGPKSEWDELYFLDFSKGDGSFAVYKIEADWIYKQKVNKQQTFEDQQDQARRPRFSIIHQIILPRGLKPVKICKL